VLQAINDDEIIGRRYVELWIGELCLRAVISKDSITILSRAIAIWGASPRRAKANAFGVAACAHITLLSSFSLHTSTFCDCEGGFRIEGYNCGITNRAWRADTPLLPPDVAFLHLSSCRIVHRIPIPFHIEVCWINSRDLCIEAVSITRPCCPHILAYFTACLTASGIVTTSSWAWEEFL